MRNTEVSLRDQYIEDLYEKESDLQLQSRQAAEDLGLARISVSSTEARLISFLVQLHGAQKCVEVGTLTGLSAQYIFAALPAGGQLWTFEKSPEHAERARGIFEQLDQTEKKIHLRIGDAKLELEKISAEGPFDLIFIDGNKAAYGDYLAWAERNLRRGGLVIADNVFLAGKVWGAETTQNFNEKQIRVMQEFNRRLANPSLYQGVLVPTHEGLFVAVKKF